MATTNNILPPIVGTIIKIAVTANLGKNIHMVDVDFNCVVFNRNNGGQRGSITLQKGDMIYVGDDEYIAVVDTTVIGRGDYYIKFSADVPDSDCTDGIRKEIVEIPTGIRVDFR